VAALEPLQRATENSDDAEIRRRAERLIKLVEPRDRALAIRRSQLGPEEKAQKLKSLLWEGMPGDDVRRLLGRPTTVLCFSGSYADYYTEYDLSIYYDAKFKIYSFR
jgi:hypothetical protein